MTREPLDPKLKVKDKEVVLSLRLKSLAVIKAMGEADVVLSLKQLGFDRREIDKVVKRTPAEIIETEDRLSWCLQNLG